MVMLMISAAYLPPPSTSERSQEANNVVTPKNNDTAKTVGLDNPETSGASAKPLGSYSIQPSGTESKGHDNSMEKLGVGDFKWIPVSRNVQVEELDCLFLVHAPDKGEHYAAWYMKPRDFTFLVAPSPHEMYMTLSFFPERIRDAETNAKNWKKEVQKYPGTTYLFGPGADKSAQELFNADPVNAAKTEKGPVSVTFDFATRSFQTNYHDRHSQS